ncbi:MAG: Hpt domain-containing protein [Thermodesulfobacteriota bacterium]
MNPIIDENILSFITESREMIEEVEPRLIELGRTSTPGNAPDMETTNLIFRLFHSIKGTAGFLQFNEVVKVTHEAETLLDMIRSGKLEMDRRNTDVLCRTCDIVNSFLDQIESTGSDTGFEAEARAIIDGLKACIQSKPGEVISVQPPPRGKHPETAPAAEIQATEPTIETTADADGALNQLLLTPEMMERFVEEALEQLEVVEESMLKLQEEPDNKETIQEAFRSLHSFKGNCGFSGFADLEKLAHKTETVMDNLKEGLLQVDPSTIQTMLYMVDIFNQAMADISKGGTGSISNSAVLLDLLEDIIATRQETPVAAPEVRPEVRQPEALFLLREKTEFPVKEEPPAQNREESPEAIASKGRSIARQDIRVNLAKLDQLINLVGELVIAEAMVTRNPDLKGYEFENLERASIHLNKIVRDLQDITLSVRMIPVSGVFRKMIRLVHDLSVKAQKKVNLELLGEETEIDKTVSELIADPLVHLVRNAIDHGLESPQERLAQGKDETGEVVLEAKHEGGEIWISIKDDGRGLDRRKIVNKAMEKGLLKDDGSHLEDSQVYDFIFHPGFSTADKVTDVSGRGVGMDVVKKNIEKIKGHIDIRSQPGFGTVIALRIPLTLAIIDGMLVRVGNARYTIPLLSIRESIQVEKDKITVTMDGQELVKVREELVPVVRLHELHRIETECKELAGGLVVIVEHRGDSAAILIDEIIGEQQAVIKGLSNYIGSVKGLSGCTILGDGEISLILDIGGLVQKAQSLAAA